MNTPSNLQHVVTCPLDPSKPPSAGGVDSPQRVKFHQNRKHVTASEPTPPPQLSKTG